MQQELLLSSKYVNENIQYKMHTVQRTFCVYISKWTTKPTTHFTKCMCLFVSVCVCAISHSLTHFIRAFATVWYHTKVSNRYVSTISFDNVAQMKRASGEITKHSAKSDQNNTEVDSKVTEQAHIHAAFVFRTIFGPCLQCWYLTGTEEILFPDANGIKLTQIKNNTHVPLTLFSRMLQ